MKKSDQAISFESGTPPNERSPGPGLKQQAIEESVPHNDIEEAQDYCDYCTNYRNKHRILN